MFSFVFVQSTNSRNDIFETKHAKRLEEKKSLSLNVSVNMYRRRKKYMFAGTKLASPLNAGLSTAMKTIINERKVSCGVFTGIHATFSRGDFFSVEGS